MALKNGKSVTQSKDILRAASETGTKCTPQGPSRRLKGKTARIDFIEVSSHTITIEMQDCRTLMFPTGSIPEVSHAPYRQRRKFRIVQDATAIEWPDIGVTVTLAEFFGVK